MEELIKLDSDFSESKFLTKVDNIFVMLCTSIMTNNLNRVAHFISDEVFKQKKSYVEELNSKNLMQMYDELNVKSTEIVDVKILDDKFVIEVKLTARYMDYLLDKSTRKFVSGNNTSRIQKDYYMIFEKRRNASKLGIIRFCPNCGAPMDLNNTGVCSFCHKVFDQENHDWILTSIRN